jgi:hypothetical protein
VSALKTRTGPRGVACQKRPRDPKTTLRIVIYRMSGLSFYRIAENVGCSHVNVFKQYHRWAGWALSELERG